MPQFRFSGHETFPCRYAWLPKAFTAIKRRANALADDEEAMVVLGVGKNMVRAIRFWMEATGLATPSRDGSFVATPFGDGLLTADPFLEDARTLWLLHWSLASHVDEPLYAWDYLLNRWSQPEFTRAAVLDAFRRDTKKLERRPLSDATLEQHFDVFLHTYVPTRGKKGAVQEDNLDSPLVELSLVHQVGERSAGKAAREPVYAYAHESHPDITPELFVYFVTDYWNRRVSAERTVTLKDLLLGSGSPGQLLKLTEGDLLERLRSIKKDSFGLFEYRESASLQQLLRVKPKGTWTLLDVFGKEAIDVAC